MNTALGFLATFATENGLLEEAMSTKDDQLTVIAAQKGSLEACLRTRDVRINVLEYDLAAAHSAGA